MHCEYKQVDRTFIQQQWSRVLVPQGGAGHGESLRLSDAFFCLPAGKCPPPGMKDAGWVPEKTGGLAGIAG